MVSFLIAEILNGILFEPIDLNRDIPHFPHVTTTCVRLTHVIPMLLRFLSSQLSPRPLRIDGSGPGPGSSGGLLLLAPRIVRDDASLGRSMPHSESGDADLRAARPAAQAVPSRCRGIRVAHALCP